MLTKNLTITAETSLAGISAQLPTELTPLVAYGPDRFLTTDFGDRALHLRGTRKPQREHSPSAAGLLDGTLKRDLAGMLADDKLMAGSSAVTTFGGSYAPAAADTASPESYLDFLQRKLSENVSFVFKYEQASAAHRPRKLLQDWLFNLTGMPSSAHLYASAAGAQVLQPHTDPYDVIVLQLAGTKQWHVCVPRENAAAEKSNLTDAQRCQLQELELDSVQGCTKYTAEETRSMRCENFTMAPGDFLYMPKGAVHYAHTADDSEAYHLTIGLHRINMQWLDVMRDVINSEEDARTIEHGAAAIDTRALRADLVEVYAQTQEGVHLHEAVPGWLLTCRRHRLLKPHEAAAPSDGRMGCDERDRELTRLFADRRERFETWTSRALQTNPETLARKLGLEPTWLIPNQHFLERRPPPNEARLAAAFDQVARVTEYHDTTQARWAHRELSNELSNRVCDHLRCSAYEMVAGSWQYCGRGYAACCDVSSHRIENMHRKL